MKLIPIKAWKLVVYYTDDTSEDITEMPDDVAQTIDDWLTEESEGGTDFE